MSMPYKGFIIDIRTMGSDDDWRALVNVEKHTDVAIDNQLLGTTFVSPTEPIPQLFKSEADALHGGLLWGQEMRDRRLAWQTR